MASGRQGCEEFAFVAVLIVLARFLLVKKQLPIYHLKFGFTYFCALAISAVWAPVFLLRPRNVRNLKFMWPLTSGLSWIVGIDFELRNGEILEKKRAAVVVANHQSTLDLIGLIKLSVNMDAVTAIAKKGLLYIFPFGPCCWLVGTIFVDRHKPKEAYLAIEEAKKWECKIWFFPEGTRNQESNQTRKFLPFKRGAFNTAISSQLPIIPVVTSPYYFVNKSKGYFSQGKVIQHVLPPIDTTGLTAIDVDDLIARTEKVMLEKYHELFAEVESTLPKNYIGLAA